MSARLPIQLLPVLLAIWLPGSFIITYIMAVSYGHIYPIWPTISNTGAVPPESCVFSLLVNLAAVIYTFVMFIRHCQLLEFTRCRPDKGPNNLLIHISAVIGYLSCLGLFFDANFQETASIVVHRIAAQTCIFASTAYFISQTVFSFWMAPDMNSVVISFLRVTTNVFNVGFIVAGMVVHQVGQEYYKGKSITEYLHWSPEMSGWPYKVATSALEWLVVLCFVMYTLTYYPEFKRIYIELPAVRDKRKLRSALIKFMKLVRIVASKVVPAKKYDLQAMLSMSHQRIGSLKFH